MCYELWCHYIMGLHVSLNNNNNNNRYAISPISNAVQWTIF